jgi:hypothetical protein
MTYTLIAHTELGSAASSITFSSIPATFTDLLIVCSLRSDASPGVVWQGVNVGINDFATAPTRRNLFGTGSATGSDSTDGFHFFGASAQATASTFGNTSLYFPNYLSSNAKSFSIDSVGENNATAALQVIAAGLWNVSSAISTIRLLSTSGSWVIGSSATLYGITAGSSGGVVVS